MIFEVDVHCYLQLVIAKITHKHVAISMCYLCTDIIVPGSNCLSGVTYSLETCLSHAKLAAI